MKIQAFVTLVFVHVIVIAPSCLKVYKRLTCSKEASDPQSLGKPIKDLHA